MTTKKSSAFFLGLLIGIAPASVFGQESKETKSSGSVTVGAQGGTGIDVSNKLQQYETVPKGVFLPEARFLWENGARVFVGLESRKLGLDDQYASLSAGKRDSFRLTATWDQNPNWLSNTARSPYAEVSPGVFHVPDGMRQALQNVYVPWIPGTATNPVGTGSAPANPTVAGFFAVEPWVSQTPPIDLRYLRKTGKAKLDFKSGENLTFNVAYGREARDGNKNTTFYAGSYNLEVATPIAYVTHDMRAEAEYAKGKVFANVSANFSKFLNAVPYAEIDNAQRLELTNPLTGRSVINDVTSFRLWLPPDNQAYTVDAAGGIGFGKRQKLTGALSVGSMSMETGLLPISTNPGLATSATAPDRAFTVVPPYGDISAKFNTLMASVRFTGDPSSKFGYILSYRKYQLSDKTDPYTFRSFARGDVGASVNAAGVTREAEGFATQSLRGEVHVLPATGLRFGVSYGQDTRHYDAREYLDVEDHNLQASADYTYKRASLHAVWTLLDRKPGSTNFDAIQPTWQGATQTDITERKRHLLSGMLTLIPTDKFSITVTGQRQRNDFAESVTGLLDQSFDSAGADVTYLPNEKFNCYAGYVFEKYFFEMAAAYIPRGLAPPFDPANLWANRTTDKVDTYRIGFNWALRPEKWQLDANLDYTKPRSESLYDFARPGTPIGGLNEANGVFPANVPPVPGFPVSTFDRFPLVSKNFIIAKINLSYHVDKNLTASVMYWKQKFDNIDWQTNNTLPYMGRVDPGANRWFFLGAQVPSYDANIFRAALSYRF